MSVSPPSTAETAAARRWIAWLLLFGLLLRLAHYLWNHTVWYDEAVLLINILGKDYLRLLGPLDYEVAAPPLFLWGLRALAEAFGDRIYVWRFPPFAISCLTLLLMAALARRVLRPAPAVLLVALVAFSDAFIWLGCNIKPYILDACLACGILLAYLRTEHWPVAGRLLLFAAAAPLLLCLSYPMLFLYAGLFLAFLPAVWRARMDGWFAYLGMAAALMMTLVCLYCGPIQEQRVSGLVAGWKNKFPDLTHPASVPGWIAGNTFLVFHYCYNPIGSVCVLMTGAGAWWCWRNRRLDLVCLCLGPVAAVLGAAIVQAYPYSNNRLIFFAAPGIGVLTGLGFSLALEKGGSRRGWVMAGLIAVFLLPECGLSLGRFYSPWDHPDSSRAARFVRQRRQPDDWIASDNGAFAYAFRGEVRPLGEAASAPCCEGQRIWVLIEATGSPRTETPRARLELARSLFDSPDWELRSETLFHAASALVFVRHATPREERRSGGRD
jgi:hypothetical protein